jgi:hypothetical protein
MKCTFSMVIVIGYLQCSEALGAPFQNLDFESANLPVIPYGQYGNLVPISNALPGWSAFLGTDPVSSVYHNNITLGPAIISVWGPDWPYGTGGRIDGDFTVVLAGSSGSLGSLAISQTGLVPADSQWLLFKGREGPTPRAVFSVSLDGENLVTTALASNPDYTLFGAEISAFAGSEADLMFRTFPGFANTLILDSIEFSPVPEPGSLSLGALGLLAGVWWRRVHSKRPRA